MKQNRHKKLIIASSLLLVLGVVGGWWWMTQADQASRFYPVNLASRGYFAIETDKGVVTLGNKKTTHKFESQIHIAPDANSSMTIQYDLGQDVEPVVENDLVKWKTDSQELFFKQIPKGESSAATVPHARDNGVLRYAPLGRTSLAEFVASYELFSSRQSSTPTVTTFVPSEDGYVFYGKRSAETDLVNPADIPYPITRIAALSNTICPVIPVTKDGLIASFIYYPHIGEKKELFSRSIVESLNELLNARGVTTKVQHKADSFFYMDGIKPVALGRIAGDEHHLGFYLYLDSPYSAPLKDYLRQRVSLQDLVLRPYGSLKDLDSTLNTAILDELMQQFAANAGYALEDKGLSKDEAHDLSRLLSHQEQPTWTHDAVRLNDPVARNYDRFEFDILLHEQPEHNVFTYHIETKNLEFRKNEAPTDEQAEGGLITNAELIGSYAAFHKSITPKAFVQAKEEWQTGKVFTIYRPKVIDANGEWEWAELEIDIDERELSVVVNEQFLMNAEYPVIVDPTIGNDDIENFEGAAGSGTGTEDQMLFGVRAMGVSGVKVVSVSASLNLKGGAANCQSVIYDVDLGAIIGESLFVTVSNNEAEIINFPFTPSIDIDHKEYMLAIGCDAVYNIQSSHDELAHLKIYTARVEVSELAIPWPNTLAGWELGHLSLKDRLFAIYATYTETSDQPPSGSVEKNFGGGTTIYGGTTVR